MSVIFQLFSAMDLTGVSTADLNKLRDEVVNALYEPAILAHVKRRADQVYEQLTTNRPTQKAISPLSQPAASIPKDQRPRGPLLFEANEYQALSAEQKQILEWAIECELQHSYRVLVAIQTRVNYFFSQLKGGHLPQGHDTNYSHIDDPLLRPQSFSREYPG
jgi:hypothetical protein